MGRGKMKKEVIDLILWLTIAGVLVVASWALVEIVYWLGYSF